MKTAQDISPTTMLCLALGPLVGMMLMPEIQKSEYAVGLPPTQEATPLDLSEGRSFERLPDNVGTSAGEVIQANFTQAGRGNGTALQELVGLEQRSWAEKPALMSDSATLTMIGFFALWGMAAAFTDVTDLSDDEEEDTPEVIAMPTKEEAAPTTVSNTTQLRILKYASNCISVAVSALGLLMCSVYFGGTSPEFAGEHFIIAELRKLENGRAEQRPALASDSCVMLVLGAAAVLGLNVMQADLREMEEELRKASSCEMKATPKVEEKQLFDPSHLIASSFFASITIFGALTFITVAMWPAGRAPLTCAEQAGITEFKAITQLVNGSVEVLMEFVLELFLGACALLGLAVMRVDICEMAQQLQDESGRDAKMKAS